MFNGTARGTPMFVRADTGNDTLVGGAGDAFSHTICPVSTSFFVRVHSGRSRYRPWVKGVAAIYHRPFGGSS